MHRRERHQGVPRLPADPPPVGYLSRATRGFALSRHSISSEAVVDATQPGRQAMHDVGRIRVRAADWGTPEADEPAWGAYARAAIGPPELRPSPSPVPAQPARPGVAVLQRQLDDASPVLAPDAQDSLPALGEDDDNSQPTADQCPPGKTTFTVAQQSYSVSAPTLNDLYWKYWAGGKEAGSVTPNIPVPKYCPDVKGEPVKSAIVTVTEEKKMPQWAELGQQCDRVKAEWNRFYQALDTHEEGHVKIDRKYLAALDQKLAGSKDPDARLNQITGQADQENDKYDQDTQHGQTQGTKINPVTCPPAPKSSMTETPSGEPLGEGEPASDAVAVGETDQTLQESA